MQGGGTGLRIVDFEWDEGNSLHLQLGHGIEPEEVEDVFANKPFFRKTKRATTRFLVRLSTEDILRSFSN